MHHCRFSSLIIVCNTWDLNRAAEFLSQALGRLRHASPNPEGSNYVALITQDDEPVIELQEVDHSSRMHLDIESDFEADVRRLEILGVKRITAIKTWVVPEAPTGHRFCVVRSQRNGKVGLHANENGHE